MGIYTQRADPEIDAMVERHLQTAVAELRCLAPDLRAIYLSGGFGRGEGTVRRTAGGWVPVNDYDFVVIGAADATRRQATAELGRRLARAFGAEYVDIGWQKPCSNEPSRTLEMYDFQQGARLLHGEEIRDFLPMMSVDQIPGFDWLRLICNRAAGLHTARSPSRQGDSHYSTTQVLKAWQAVGDVVVAVVSGYVPQVAARRDVFCQLAEQGRLPTSLAPDDAAVVREAYDLKLQGWSGNPPAIRSERLGSVLAKLFCWLVACELGEPESPLPDALRSARRMYAVSPSPWWRGLGRALKRRHWGYCAGDAAYIARHVLFAQVAVAAAHDRGAAAERREYLRQFWWVPGAWRLSPDGAGAGQLWERFAHG